jgi:Gram-negative porin
MHQRLLAALAAALASFGACAQETYPDVTFSGFGTLGLVQTDTNAGRYATSVLQPLGAGKDLDWRTDSLLGGQVNARFTRSLSVVAQVVANKTADNDFMPHFEWAFARYAITPDLAVRGGIMAVPLFMLSDSRLVGISFPWVRPPTAVYSQAPITNFLGADLTYRVAFGDASFTVQPYVGEAPTDVPLNAGGVVRSDLDRVAGLGIRVERGPWTARASWFQSRFTYRSPTTELLATSLHDAAAALPGALELANEISSVDKRLVFASVGVAYDGERTFFQAEYGRRKSETFLASTNAWYATLGYRFGNVMPHLTVSGVNVTSRTTQDVIPGTGRLAPLAASVNSLLSAQDVRQETLALGMRWQFRKNADLKVQWDHVRLPGGAVGNFHGTPGFADSVNVYSAALDFVF